MLKALFTCTCILMQDEVVNHCKWIDYSVHVSGGWGLYFKGGKKCFIKKSLAVDKYLITVKIYFCDSVRNVFKCWNVIHCNEGKKSVTVFCFHRINYSTLPVEIEPICFCFQINLEKESISCGK